MAKKAIGKIIVALLSVVLCFGFVGVKEAHAATNKVINQKTGVQYNTLSAAISALGQGSPEDSVTLTVDGTINETTADITVDYRGELSIVGGSGGGTILHYHNNNNTSGDHNAKIIFTKNSKIKTIKNIMFQGCTLPMSPGGRVAYYCHKLYFYGTVEELNNIDYRDVYGGGIIHCCSGSEIGRVINCNYDTPQDYRNFILSVEENVTVDEIRDSSFPTLDVKGNVTTIENVVVPVAETNAGAFRVAEGGYVDKIKNLQAASIHVEGTVNIMDGIKAIGGWYDGGTPTDVGYPVLTILTTGRVNKIIGGSLIAPAENGWCIENNSQYPVELEPDLNGSDLTEGYGRYGGNFYGIVDNSGTIVYPVSASGYYYELPIGPSPIEKWCRENYGIEAWSEEFYNNYDKYDSEYQSYYDEAYQNWLNTHESFLGSDGYYHMKVGNVKASDPAAEPTISKRLLQNNTAATPNMTFNFTFTQLDQWDGVSYVSTDASTAAPIADKSVTITSQSEVLTSDAYVGNLTGKKLYQEKTGNVLSGFVPKTTGTYCYLVKEDNSNPIADVTYTGSEFIMLVEVEDTGGGVLKPKTVTNILYKDSAGKTKADYTTPPSVFDEKHELIFYNNYGTDGGTTPTGIITNNLPFIVIIAGGVGGAVAATVIKAKKRAKR